MTRLYDALQIDVALVGCFVDPRREAQGWHPVFWGKLQRILFKSPPPFRRILTKDSSKTFTKLSLTFTKLSPKGPKRGEKVDFFLFFFLQLPPTLRNSSGTKESHTFAPSVETNEAR